MKRQNSAIGRPITRPRGATALAPSRPGLAILAGAPPWSAPTSRRPRGSLPLPRRFTRLAASRGRAS